MTLLASMQQRHVPPGLPILVKKDNSVTSAVKSYLFITYSVLHLCPIAV